MAPSLLLFIFFTVLNTGIPSTSIPSLPGETLEREIEYNINLIGIHLNFII